MARRETSFAITSQPMSSVRDVSKNASSNHSLFFSFHLHVVCMDAMLRSWFTADSLVVVDILESDIVFLLVFTALLGVSIFCACEYYSHHTLRTDELAISFHEHR